MLRCTNCPNAGPFEDYRGARGHAKFTDDDAHGPEGEVPDDYKSMFEETDEGNEDSDSDSGSEDGETDSGETSKPEEQPTSTSSSNTSDGESTESTGNGESTVSRILNADLLELFGGGR